MLRDIVRFYSKELLASRPTPNWRTTPYRLSAGAYSVYSQISSIYGGVDGRIILNWIFKDWDGLLICLGFRKMRGVSCLADNQILKQDSAPWS